MKFQKGLLNQDDEEIQPPKGEKIDLSRLVPVEEGEPIVLHEIEKDRLFQTVKEETGSERNYLKLLAIVAIAVLIGGAIVFYLTLPGVGDQIDVSTEQELALRDHFQLKEKRTATNIVFYQCDGYQWAKVDVEVRKDIKTNPVYAIDKYTARIQPTSDGKYNITAQPITSNEVDVPCK